MPAELERRAEERDGFAMREETWEESLDDSGPARIGPFGAGKRGIARVLWALGTDAINGAMVNASAGAVSAANRRQTVVPLSLSIFQGACRHPERAR